MEADRVTNIIDKIANGESVDTLLQSIDGKDKKELEFLMPAINKLAHLSSITPDEGLKDKIKAQIMEKVAQDKAASNVRLFRPRFGARLRPVAILAAMMLLGTGTAFASTGAMPDSMLYPVKKAIESVSKNMANNKSRTLQILTFNQRRIEEIQYLKATNDGKGIGQLVKEINMNIKELKLLSKDISRDDRKNIEDKLAKFLDKNQRLIAKQEAKIFKGSNRPKPSEKAIKDKAQDRTAIDENNNTGKNTERPAAKVAPKTPAPKVNSGSRPAPSKTKKAPAPKPSSENSGKKQR